VARFGRLQDTTGDKLLPALLRYVGQTPGPALDNLHLAEKWGWVSDAQSWMNARQLRNQMVHEYIKDAAVLCDALNTGHDLVPLLTGTAQTLLIEAHSSTWGGRIGVFPHQPNAETKKIFGSRRCTWAWRGYTTGSVSNHIRTL
jgi:hypothetical protein